MDWSWIAWILVLTFGIIVLRGAPYVPSRKRYIDYAFTKLYKLGKNDVLVDVGSGDGVVLRAASKTEAKVFGYELNPILVIVSWIMSRGDRNVHIKLRDFWIAKLPDDITVVYAFMATPYVQKLDKKIQQEATRLKKPIYLILYGNGLIGRTHTKAGEGYRLYKFLPLQMDKP